MGTFPWLDLSSERSCVVVHLLVRFAHSCAFRGLQSNKLILIAWFNLSFKSSAVILWGSF
jgi:hypothetical protein